MIFLLDPDGRIRTWNTEAARIKGDTADESIGRHFSVFYPADDIALEETAARADRRGTQRQGGREGWRVRKNGTRFWANVVINPFATATGT